MCEILCSCSLCDVRYRSRKLDAILYDTMSEHSATGTGCSSFAESLWNDENYSQGCYLRSRMQARWNSTRIIDEELEIGRRQFSLVFLEIMKVDLLMNKAAFFMI